MKKEIQDRWVLALRSGEYRQGRDALNKNGKFCCLGVLCDLFSEERPGDVEILEDFGGSVTYDGRDDFPPTAVQEWAGLSNESGYFVLIYAEAGDTIGTGFTLADLNDEGFTFNEIADLIEHLGAGL